MNTNDIQQQRTEVVEKYINLEILINACISQYFFKNVNSSFYFYVLFDPHFSYQLRINIFKKIVSGLPPENYTGDREKLIRKLQRVGDIRNIFIHVAGLKFYPSKEGRSDIVITKSLIEEEGITPDPKNPSSPLDFKKLYEEYLSLEKFLNQEISSIYQVLGGQFVQ